MNHPSLILGLTLALSGALTSQTCLTTGFAGGNGGGAGGAVYFDATVTPTGGLTFTSMDLNLDTAAIGSTVGCEVWARFGGTHVGNEGAPGWFLVTEGSGTMAGTGAPTTMAFNFPFWLPAGSHGIAIVATGGASHDYTNGNGTNQTASNPDLTLSLGTASNTPFTSSIFTPRVANLTLCYNLGGGTAYPWFDASRRAGSGPLVVDFFDRSYTDDPAGIQLWQWDFNSDGTIDVQGSTPAEQNPQWVFGAGTYSVTLTVLDVFGLTSRTRTDLIRVGAPTNNTDSADLLHLTFNDPPRAGDLRVYNAASSDLGPSFGSMSNDNWQDDPMRPGFAGQDPGFGCLGEAGVISANALDTGLSLDVTDMTISWWHRVGTTGAGTANAFAYVFGGPSSSMRCFVDGAAGNGLIRYAGTGAGNVDSLTDIKTGLANQWTHLALRIDNTAGTADWYINGVLDGGAVFTPGAHSVQHSPLWVGFDNGTQNYSLFYSMDDFRVYGRALSPAEIAAIAGSTEPAVTAIYGDGCPGAGGLVPTIAASGGAPAVGNPLFALELTDAEPGSLGVLALGASATQLTAGGSPLPLPLGTFAAGFAPGCNLEVGDLASTAFVFPTNGAASLTLPIPNSAALSGLHFYGQWGLLGSVNAASQAIDISLQ